jgi:chemotaxis response regulator CheB
MSSKHPYLAVGIFCSIDDPEPLTQILRETNYRDDLVFFVMVDTADDDRDDWHGFLSETYHWSSNFLETPSRLCSGAVHLLRSRDHLILSQDMVSKERHGDAGNTDTIDRFFCTLADHFGESTIGVVLSGRTIGGAVGMQKIKSCHGLSLVQAPNSCRYFQAPRYIIKQQAFHTIFSPHEIAARIFNFEHSRTEELKKSV